MKTLKNISNFSWLLRGQNGLVWTPTFAYKGFIKDSLKAITTGNKSNSNLTFIIANPKHYIAFHLFWKIYGLEKFSSTGFYTISCALTLCKNVHVFGFWPFDKSLTSSTQNLRYHYYNEIKGSKRVHDMPLEFKWILSMHHFGLLQLHVGKCTN